MRFDLEYWKTDRNGTKYYLDRNCPRCAGYGEASKWEMTGRVCYACGGSGERAKAKVVKVYTPEHEAKLEARRLAKVKPISAEDEAELERKNAEARRGNLIYTGLDENGNGYVHHGDTYRHRDTFRASGAKWCVMMKAYIAPKQILLNGVDITPVTAEDICYPDGRLDSEKAWDFSQKWR